LQTSALQTTVAGDFLAFVGNVLNVTEDFTRIADVNGNTWIKTDNNPGGDSDSITMRLGLNPALWEVPGTANGDIVVFSSSPYGDAFTIESPSGVLGTDVPGFPITIRTGAGDGSAPGGNIGIIAGEGGDDADGGTIEIRSGLGGGGGNEAGAIILSAADANTGADAGVIEIHAGDATGSPGGNDGGYVELRSGDGDNGGLIDIRPGVGTVGHGGDIELTAGNGVTRGGNVDIEPGLATGSPVVPGAVRIKRQAPGASSPLLFMEGAGATGHVGFKAPLQVSDGGTGDGLDTVWTLPEGDGTAGQLLSTDGNGVLSWFTAGGSLPTSITECNVLVADGEGGFYERAVPELSRPYDIAAQVFGSVPDNQTIFKFVTPQKFTLLDYGHQGTSGVNDNIPGLLEIYTGAPDVSTTFPILVNGVQIGQIGIHDANYGGVGPPPAVHFFSDVGSLNGIATGSYLGTMPVIEVGDIIEIKSPVSANVELEDVAFTLRGIIAPAAPCGSLTAAFTGDKDATSFEVYEEGGGEGSDFPLDFTITGSATHVEWAVLGYVPNADWPPSAANDLLPLATSGAQFRITFDSGPVVVFDNSSQYYETGELEDEITDIHDFGSQDYWLVRLTAFGPAGIGTKLAWMKPLGA